MSMFKPDGSVDPAALRNMTRAKYDECTQEAANRVTSGAARYVLGGPASSCNAAFAPEPTVRAQRWGAAQVLTATKTDVESDLLNLKRAPGRTGCGQYDPLHNDMNSAPRQPAREVSFPQVATRLQDPPTTLRGTGVNRWQWLCQNPQEGALLPFAHALSTRMAVKDAHVACLPRPVDQTPVLPAPLHTLPGPLSLIAGVDLPGGGSQAAFP